MKAITKLCFAYINALFFEIKSSKFRLFSNSISFYTLYAIVPLLAISFSLLQAFNVESFLNQLLTEILTPIGADSNLIKHYLITFVNNSKSGIIGGIGITFFLYVTFSLFNRISEAINHLWYVSVRRSLLERATQYMGMMMFIIILAIGSTILNILSDKDGLILLNLHKESFSGVILFFNKGFSILLTALVLALVYKSVPNTQVKFLPAFFGGLFCAILWLPATWVFSTIISTSSKYSIIYGGVASFFIGLLWLNVLWTLFLLGAKASFIFQYPSTLSIDNKRVLSLSEIEESAICLIDTIKHHFSEKQGSVSIYQLMSATQLDYDRTKQLLFAFIEQKIITEVNEGSNCFILSVPPKEITNESVTTIIRQARYA